MLDNCLKQLGVQAPPGPSQIWRWQLVATLQAVVASWGGAQFGAVRVHFVLDGPQAASSHPPQTLPMAWPKPRQKLALDLP